jgi:peroxiredoxin
MKIVLNILVVLALVTCPLTARGDEPAKQKDTPQVESKLAIGQQAPAFKIKDATGKEINLADLTAKGPVLVRLTCGCSGCDKELAYFQELHSAYEGKGLTSLAVFREPDEKVEKYVQEKKLKMLYAVDTQGESWKVFQTKTMPTNFLIDKGGKIVSVAAGCDPSGLLANVLSGKVAGLIDAEKADVKAQVDAKKAVDAQPKK